MIDVQPYIDKLELCKEWISSAIDGFGKAIWVDYKVLPPMTPEEIFELYWMTGYLFVHNDDCLRPVYRTLTFEEYYQSKINDKSPKQFP